MPARFSPTRSRNMIRLQGGPHIAAAIRLFGFLLLAVPVAMACAQGVSRGDTRRAEPRAGKSGAAVSTPKAVPRAPARPSKVQRKPAAQARPARAAPKAA